MKVRHLKEILDKFEPHEEVFIFLCGNIDISVIEEIDSISNNNGSMQINVYLDDAMGNEHHVQTEEEKKAGNIYKIGAGGVEPPRTK